MHKSRETHRRTLETRTENKETNYVSKEEEERMGKQTNIPVKSYVDFGLIIPTLGRTQYLFGDVVLTYIIIADLR